MEGYQRSAYKRIENGLSISLWSWILNSIGIIAIWLFSGYDTIIPSLSELLSGSNARLLTATMEAVRILAALMIVGGLTENLRISRYFRISRMFFVIRIVVELIFTSLNAILLGLSNRGYSLLPPHILANANILYVIVNVAGVIFIGYFAHYYLIRGYTDLARNIGTGKVIPRVVMFSRLLAVDTAIIIAAGIAAFLSYNSRSDDTFLLPLPVAVILLAAVLIRVVIQIRIILMTKRAAADVAALTA